MAAHPSSGLLLFCGIRTSDRPGYGEVFPPLWLMPQTNTAFALLTLGQWCRNHGIYEVRDVLAKAAYLAEGAESSELLAAALEEASIAADVVVCPAPVPKAPELPVDEDEQPRRKGKRTGGAHVDIGPERS